MTSPIKYAQISIISTNSKSTIYYIKKRKDKFKTKIPGNHQTMKARRYPIPIYKIPGSKDGKQKYRVRINYTDRSGRERQLTRIAYGSIEAKMLEAQLKKEYSNDPAKMTSRITVKELYDQYMEAKKHELRATSYDKTRRRLNAYALPSLGDIRLAD